MKTLLIIVSIMLTGCATNEIICRGAGTCYTNLQGETVMANGSLASGSRSFVPTGGQQIQLPTGGYMVVRSQSTGQIMSVIQTSRGK